jgi:hypothetical protein
LSGPPAGSGKKQGRAQRAACLEAEPGASRGPPSSDRDVLRQLLAPDARKKQPAKIKGRTGVGIGVAPPMKKKIVRHIRGDRRDAIFARESQRSAALTDRWTSPPGRLAVGATGPSDASHRICSWQAPPRPSNGGTPSAAATSPSEPRPRPAAPRIMPDFVDELF